MRQKEERKKYPLEKKIKQSKHYGLIVLETNLHRIRTNALVEDEINNQFNGWAFILAGKLNSTSLRIRYYFLGNR